MKNSIVKDLAIGVAGSLIASVIIYLVNSTNVTIDALPSSSIEEAELKIPERPKREIKLTLPYSSIGVKNRLKTIYVKSYYFFYNFTNRPFLVNALIIFLGAMLCGTITILLSLVVHILFGEIELADYLIGKYGKAALVLVALDYFFFQGYLVYFSLFSLTILVVYVLSATIQVIYESRILPKSKQLDDVVTKNGVLPGAKNKIPTKIYLYRILNFIISTIIAIPLSIQGVYSISFLFF